ncbi:MAG: hypothetical protein P8J37_00630 [Fuerstiella sp.]|nr:hypothetical protein [Fuerstiella sp.]
MTDTANTNDKRTIALIPILGLVLIYVLMGSEDTSGSPAIQLSSQPIINAELGVSEVERRPGSRNVAWPGRSLQVIVQHNPFELTDPRAILDAEFERYGITEVAQMTAVEMTVFFQNDGSADGQLKQWATDVSNAQHDAGGADASAASTPPNLIVDLAAVAATELRRARIEELQHRILVLQKTPVTMVMISNRGSSALLGDRRITQGELLEDGIRAISISRNGITFKIVDDTNSR